MQPSTDRTSLTKFQCSQCRQPIPGEDINVANDVAFCRRCNVGLRLSALINLAEFDPHVDVNRPPDGAWYRRDGATIVMGAIHRTVGNVLKWFAVSAFWNGMLSVFLLVALSGTMRLLGLPAPAWFPEPKVNDQWIDTKMAVVLWVFLTPFILIGVLMLAELLSSIWGRTEIRIDGANGSVFVGIGPVGYSRRFDAGKVQAVRVFDGEDSASRRIVLEAEGRRPILFGTMFSKDRLKWVAAVALKELTRVR